MIKFSFLSTHIYIFLKKEKEKVHTYIIIFSTLQRTINRSYLQFYKLSGLKINPKILLELNDKLVCKSFHYSITFIKQACCI